MDESREGLYSNKVKICVDFDHGTDVINLKVTDVLDCHRMYKEQYVLFLEGVIRIEPVYNHISIRVDTPLNHYVIPFTRNDVIHATICDFTNGKTSSAVAFGSNDLYKVECIDDMENPLLARAKLINGVIVLDRIRIIVDDV